MDESGHDHRTMPYEVRGGFAISAEKLWPFVRALQALERECFGIRLALYGKELKGSKLLDKDRFKWADQGRPMNPEERGKHSRRFLDAGQKKRRPSRDDFTAYGQACLEMARGSFELLRSHEAVVFAAAIPRGVEKPIRGETAQYLRKDHVFLLERFFYFLEERQASGLLVLDETDKNEDLRFVRRLESYFTRTQPGRYRSNRIVPVPLFVASDMAYPIQIADLVIYCVNCGFRLIADMDNENRAEISEEFEPWLRELQYRGQNYRDGKEFYSYGIFLVRDPYSNRLA